MFRWSGRIALVTGASVGIGAAICKKLVQHGLTVIGCARNADLIEALSKEEELKSFSGTLHAVKCDLALESDILSMFEEIREKYGRLDILINNAGFSTNSPLLTGETKDWRSMLEVNVLALSICSREAVKLMREKSIEEGQIIHISSIAGHKMPEVTMAGFNFYCGTKFMIRALTEGLRQEVKAGNNDKSQIRVASISPGLVETEFLSRCLSPEMANHVYSAMPCLQPKDVADTVVYILEAPPRVNVSDVLVLPVEKGES